MSQRRFVRGFCLRPELSSPCGGHGFAAVAVALCGLSVLGGCGRGGPVRFDIAGTVNYDGKPLPQGTIRFEPNASQGNRGPVGIAAIVEGRYSTATSGCRGTLEGPLVVWITGLPAADAKEETVRPLFQDYRVEIDFHPGRCSLTPLDFEVPRNAGRK